MELWISKNEAVHLTNKSPATIDRYISKYKKDSKKIKYDGGSPLINSTELSRSYHFVNDNQNTSNDNHNEEAKHKKEALEIAYKAEDLKAQSDILKAKDKQIEQLINRKSSIPLWLSLGFIILIIILAGLGYIYRSELVDTYNSKITTITESSQNEIKTLTSGYENELKSLKDQLLDTKKSSAALLAEIKTTYSKLTDNQAKALDKKEIEIENLQKKLEEINRQIEVNKILKE
jgi:hypothetical protein